MDPITKLNIASCTPIVCDTNCAEGYEYETSSETCCGECVQKSCVFTAPDNAMVVIKLNETYVPPDDKCVKYTCEKIGKQFVTKEIKTTCPYYNPKDCEPGTETTDADGCCMSCKSRHVCEVRSEETVIEVGDCKSGTVNITSCAGQCGSSSIYSAAANTMMHQCECCQETKTSQKEVEMQCADGSKRTTTYILVEECSCNPAKCVESTLGKRRRRR
ncbi:hypothetical protein LDENG_00021170 [Lucifuga dentata]|nr:hypothetical protein LDENG_00021170 [Lucifuga dentata]